MKQSGSFVLALAVLLALGCASRGGGTRGGGGGTDGDGGGSGADGGGTGWDAGPVVRRDGAPPTTETEQCTKMDVLFVIDDSGSMAEEQTNLAANFPRFIEVLDGYTTDTGEPLDYRLGVTTTGTDITTRISFTGFPLPPMEISEEGPEGALLQPGDCGMSRPWIERTDSDVAGTFSCVAQVGTSGSSVEMPLYALELALTERVADGSNAGFLREDALLAVVILSDENDCSRLDDPIEITIDPTMSTGTAVDSCDPENPAIEPVPRFLGVLDSVTGDRGRWASAVIAGPGPGTCSSEFGDAIEATRLKDFVDMAGENAVFSSICEGDLSGALMRAIETFEAACESFPPLI